MSSSSSSSSSSTSVSETLKQQPVRQQQNKEQEVQCGHSAQKKDTKTKLTSSPLSPLDNNESLGNDDNSQQNNHHHRPVEVISLPISRNLDKNEATTNTSGAQHHIYALAQQDIITSSTRGHPIELITFPSKGDSNLFNNGDVDDDADDEEEEDLENKSQDVKISTDRVVDNGGDEDEDEDEDEDDNVLNRFEVFFVLLFLGSIAFVGCWTMGYAAPNFSSSAPNLSLLLIKLSGWFILIFLGLIPKEQQKQREQKMFLPRKMQMLIVYMISWNLFVEIQREQIHHQQQQPASYRRSKAEIKLNTTDLDRMLHNLSDHKSSSSADQLDGICDWDDSPFYAAIGAGHHHVNLSSSKFIQSCCRRKNVPKKKSASTVDSDLVVEMEKQQRTTSWKRPWKWRPRDILEPLTGFSPFEMERTPKNHAVPSQDRLTENGDGERISRNIPEIVRSSQASGGSSTQSDDDASTGHIGENNNRFDTSIWSDEHSEDQSFAVGTNSLSQSDSPYQMTSSSSESYLQRREENSQPPMDWRKLSLGSYYSHDADQDKHYPFVGNQEHNKLGGEPSLTSYTTHVTGKSMATTVSESWSASITFDQVVTSSSPAGSAKSFDKTVKVDQGVTLDGKHEEVHDFDLNTKNTVPCFGTIVDDDTMRNDNDAILSSTNANEYDEHDVDGEDASVPPNNGLVDKHHLNSEALIGRDLIKVDETRVIDDHVLVHNHKANANELLAVTRTNSKGRVDASQNKQKSAVLEDRDSKRTVDDKLLLSSPEVVVGGEDDVDTQSSIDEADSLQQDQTFYADNQEGTGFEHGGAERDNNSSSLNVDSADSPEVEVVNNVAGVVAGVDEADTLEDRTFDADDKAETGVEPGDREMEFSDANLKTESTNEFSGSVVIAGIGVATDEQSLCSPKVSLKMFEEDSGVSLCAEESSVPEGSTPDASEKDIERGIGTKRSDRDQLDLSDRIVPFPSIVNAAEFMNGIVIGDGKDANDGQSLSLPEVVDADAVGALSSIEKPVIFEGRMYDSYGKETPDESHEVGDRIDLIRLILSESAVFDDAHADGADDTRTMIPYEKCLTDQSPSRSPGGVDEITKEAAAFEQDAFALTPNGEDKQLQSSPKVDVPEGALGTIKEKDIREDDTTTRIPEGGDATGEQPSSPPKVVVDVGTIKEKDKILQDDIIIMPLSQPDVVAVDFSEHQRQNDLSSEQQNEEFEFWAFDAFGSQQNDKILQDDTIIPPSGIVAVDFSEQQRQNDPSSVQQNEEFEFWAFDAFDSQHNDEILQDGTIMPPLSQPGVVAVTFFEQQRQNDPSSGQKNEELEFWTFDAFDSQHKYGGTLHATEAHDTGVRIDADRSDHTAFVAQHDKATNLDYVESFVYDSTEAISDDSSSSDHDSPIPSPLPLLGAPAGPSAPILSRAPVAKAALLLSKTAVGKDLVGKVYFDDGAIGGYPRISAIDDFNEITANSKKVKPVQAEVGTVTKNEGRSHHGPSGPRDIQLSSRLSSSPHDSSPNSSAYGRRPRNIIKTIKLKLGLSRDEGLGPWKAVPVSTDTHALFVRHSKNRDHPKGMDRRFRVSASSTSDNADCSFWKRVSIAVNRRIDAFMGLSVHTDPSCPSLPPRRASQKRNGCIVSPYCTPISTVGT